MTTTRPLEADARTTGVDAPPVTAPSRGGAALAGVLATFAALGAGELVAGLGRRLASPAQAVAEAVIALAPGPVERWAVRTLGTADKPVLVASVLVVCALLGAVIGVLCRRRPARAAVAVALFGLLGAAAALRSTGGDVLSVVPSAVAAVVGAAVVLLLLRSAPRRALAPAAAADDDEAAARDATAPADVPFDVQAPADADAPTTVVVQPSRSPDRRRFLALSGVTAVGAVAAAAGGRLLESRSTVALVRERETAAATFPTPADPALPVPAGAEVGVEGMEPFVTPEADFYRVDTALTIPQVDVATWTLALGGMVQRPLTFTYDDLLRRPHVERHITLTCVSNEVGGRLASHASWQGILLRDLLDEAGVDPRADQVVGRSVDDYTCGFPVTAAMDRDALLVVGMNGEPLPVERGFPARLVVPGLYGYVSATKWLEGIELTRFDEFDQYWVRREWDAQAPIKTLSRIDVPRPGGVVELGPVDVAGVAWAQGRGIDRVEVRVDDEPWADADLGDAVNDDSWRQWRFRWDAATPGPHRITVRATDGTGEVQTEERAAPFPNGASGWMTSLVSVLPGTS